MYRKFGFLQCCVIFHIVHILQLVYPFICRSHLGCFQFLSTTNEAVMNICIQICVNICFRFSWLIFSNGISELYGYYMLNFTRKCQRVFQSDHAILCSHNAKLKRSSCSTSLPTLVIIQLLNFCHSSECEVISLCVLICISLITNDSEYILVYFLDIRMSSFVKCPI